MWTHRVIVRRHQHWRGDITSGVPKRAREWVRLYVCTCVSAGTSSTWDIALVEKLNSILSQSQNPLLSL